MADENTTSTTPAPTASAAPATGTAPAMPEGMGDAGKKALQEERAARGDAERTAAEARRQLEQAQTELQQFRDRDKTEAEKLTERVTTAETTAASATSMLMRYEVAAEKNLPLSMATRLQGSTRDELAKDAEALSRLLTPSFDNGVRTTAVQPDDMDSAIRRRAGYQ